MFPISYRRHRFPPALIQHAVWLYLRFTLSYRDVEELLAQRGLELSYESVRCWVLKFGPMIAQRLMLTKVARPARRIASCSTWMRSSLNGSGMYMLVSEGMANLVAGFARTNKNPADFGRRGCCVRN